MELSKLNISSIAKEEIRRRFFDSRSAKNKRNNGLDTSDKKSSEYLKSGEEEMSPTINREGEKTVVPRMEEEAPTNENHGFPLITSVFSLALSSGVTNEGCVSTDDVNTPVTSDNSTNTTTHSSNDMLPFVVKCNPSGVITVSSSSNPTSSSSHFREKLEGSTTITCSLQEPVCSVDFTDKTSLSLNMADQRRVIPVKPPGSEGDKCLLTDNTKTLNNSGCACPKSTSESELENPEIAVSLATAKRSRGKKETQSLPTSENSQVKTRVRTPSSGLLSSVALAKSDDTEGKLINDPDPCCLCHTSSDNTASQGSGIPEEYVCDTVPTRQEEKIRKLKDLLRQKEAELEKFRITGQTVSNSAAERLRANFLKKNPSLRRRSQRLNTNERENSNCEQKELESDTMNELACEKNVSSENDMNVSIQDDTPTTSSKKYGTKFTEEENYKLVNVTILQGHTRTLAVPVHSENVKTVSMANDTPSKTRHGSSAAETITRNRKKELPRMVELSPSKLKSKCDEHAASRRASKVVATLTPETSKLQFRNDLRLSGPTGPNTRSSPRRREGHQSVKAMAEKRTYPSAFVLKTRSGLSAPKKKLRIVSTEEGKVDHALTSSRVGDKTESTKQDEKCSIQQSETQNDHTFNEDSVIIEPTNKKIAHVVYMRELSAATNPKTKSQTSSKCNEEIGKRAVESRSQDVFALVSKAQGGIIETVEDSMGSNATVCSPLHETKATSGVLASFSRSGLEPEILHLTGTTNISANATETSSPEASKFATTSGCKLIVPLMKNATADSPKTSSQNTILSSRSNITSTNSYPKVSFPEKFVVANKGVIYSDTNSTDGRNGQEDGDLGNIVLEVKSESDVMTKRTLAPKPVYTIAALSVPVPLTNNASSGVSKTRPLAPKPLAPQCTSQRLFASTTPPSVAYVPVCHPATPQGASQPVVTTCASIPCPSTTKLVASKLASPSIATKSATSETLNQVINVLPRPIMAVPTSSSTVFPESLNNGKIFVYDVVQSHLAQGGRGPPLMSKEAAKLVVYVSNTGESRNLGIIKDKKIYLNSNQVAAVASQPQPKSPAKTSTSEFMPNPEDRDFKVLLGLEHVVKLLTYD